MNFKKKSRTLPHFVNHRKLDEYPIWGKEEIEKEEARE